MHKIKYFDRWEGEGVNEIGKDKDTGIVRVSVNPKYFRPTEVVSLESEFCFIGHRYECMCSVFV